MADSPPSTNTTYRGLGCGMSSNLMEGGVGNLTGLNCRGPFSDLCQGLLHLGISIAVIGFRALFPVPQADSNRFCPTGNGESNFAQQTVLLSKQRKDFLLDCSGELRYAVGLKMQGGTSCKNSNLLGCGLRGAIAGNPT